MFFGQFVATAAISSILHGDAVLPEQHQTYALTLRRVFTYLLERGISEEFLLQGTDMSREDMDDPYCVVSTEQARQFYLNVLHHSDQPGIGLEVGWLSDLADAGAYGLVLKTARTVGEVIEESTQNYAFYYQMADWLVRTEDDELRIRVVPHTREPDLHRFLVERIFAGNQANAEELSGGKIQPIRMRLDYPAPENSPRYEQIFQCPVHFSQELCELHYDAAVLDLPVVSYDPEVKEVMKALRTNLLARLVSNRDVVSEVKLHLRREPGQFPTLEEVASCLAMSSRTLRRRLGDKETSVQALLDAQRHGLARDFLVGTTMNIQQVADYCGFNDARNFTQAFKRWQGATPTEYREATLGL